MILYVQKNNGRKILIKTKSTLFVFCHTAFYTKMFSTKPLFPNNNIKTKNSHKYQHISLQKF